MTADIHALTGAYALEAVTELERVAFERHLAECDACAQEVRELRETATRLGGAVSVQPPAELKSRVLAEIGRIRQIPPAHEDIAGDGRAAARRKWPMRLTTAAAAVLLVVSVALGIAVVRGGERVERQEQQITAMTELLSADDAKVASSGDGGGLRGTVVRSKKQGKVMLVAGNVPPAPSGKSYQVWLMGDFAPHSVGLIAPDGAGSASILDASGIDAENIGITVEPAGGSPGPTSEPIMAMSLPA